MIKTILTVIILSVPTLSLADAPVLKSKEAYEKDSQQICYEKWNKRGKLDRRMYNHCMEGQKDGYDELIHVHQHLVEQRFYSETSFPYCRDRWTKRGVSDTRMMAHCLNQEIEGIKDVMYYREKHGVDEVNQIVDRAIAQFKSWNMAAYKVKQYFE